MKLYSSGMKARLAFSLFAFLDCDVSELSRVEVNNQIEICDIYEKVATFYIKPHYTENEHSHFGICNLPGDCQIQVISNLEAEAGE